jgi:hypothetical protein
LNSLTYKENAEAKQYIDDFKRKFLEPRLLRKEIKDKEKMLLDAFGTTDTRKI